MSKYEAGQVWLWNEREVYMLLERLRGDMATVYNNHSEHWHAIRLDDDAARRTVVMHGETHGDGARWERL